MHLKFRKEWTPSWGQHIVDELQICSPQKSWFTVFGFHSIFILSLRRALRATKQSRATLGCLGHCEYSEQWLPEIENSHSEPYDERRSSGIASLRSQWHTDGHVHLKSDNAFPDRSGNKFSLGLDLFSQSLDWDPIVRLYSSAPSIIRFGHYLGDTYTSIGEGNMGWINESEISTTGPAAHWSLHLDLLTY